MITTRFSVGNNSTDTDRPAPAASSRPATRLAWDVPYLAVCWPGISFGYSSFRVTSSPLNPRA